MCICLIGGMGRIGTDMHSTCQSNQMCARNSLNWPRRQRNMIPFGWFGIGRIGRICHCDFYAGDRTHRRTRSSETTYVVMCGHNARFAEQIFIKMAFPIPHVMSSRHDTRLCDCPFHYSFGMDYYLLWSSKQKCGAQSNCVDCTLYGVNSVMHFYSTKDQLSPSSSDNAHIHSL